MNTTKFFALICAAFLGALFGHHFLKTPLAEAQRTKGTTLKQLFLVQGNQSHSSLTKYHGGGFLAIGDIPNKQMRLQFGIYNASNEKGLPLVGLNDKNGRLRLLFRLASGINSSPVIIFKGPQGQDSLVLGLDLTDSTEEPFINYRDAFRNHEFLEEK